MWPHQENVSLSGHLLLLSGYLPTVHDDPLMTFCPGGLCLKNFMILDYWMTGGLFQISLFKFLASLFNNLRHRLNMFHFTCPFTGFRQKNTFLSLKLNSRSIKYKR